MGVTKEQLAKIIQGKAKEMCSPENDNKRSVSKRGVYGADPDPSAYDADAAMLDSMYSYAAAEDHRPMRSAEPQYTESSFANSRMPDKIKQSMMNERIDVSAMNPNRSVLDTLGITTQPRQQQLNEQQQPTQPQYTPQPQYAPQQIDYALIKSIMKECLNEFLSQDGGYLTHIALQKGTIKLVDSKDNVYVAKLEKVGQKKKED